MNFDHVDLSMLPKKVTKIDFENNTIIGCVPKYVLKTPPTDQSPCILEECPSCKMEMWASEKKRQWRSSKPHVILYCMPCVLISANQQGYDAPEPIDLNKVN